MDRFWNKTITRRLTRILLQGFVICSIVYGVILHFGKQWLEDYFVESDYIYQSQQKDIEELQLYVSENHISAEDYDALRNWADHSKVKRLTVARDRVLLCDTGYKDFIFENKSETGHLHENWMYFHPVSFADGTADVFVYADYDAVIYSIFYSAVLGVCMFLWMVFFSAGLRGELKYIRSLNQKIRRIEAGDLSERIPSRGPDELGNLAAGLDQMRLSLLANKEHELEMKAAQDKLIIGMAHDLRTPMTSLMTYLELARKHSENTDTQTYLGKALSKIMEIRDLSDHLFEYFKIRSGTAPALEKTEMTEQAIGDYFSELYVLLTNAGFRVNTAQLTWHPANVKVSFEYMGRIMDNLYSNIRRYADPQQEIVMTSLIDDKYFRISVTNHCLKEYDIPDRNGIGVKNIQEMMKQMGGSCQIERTETQYQISLFFPVCSE